MIKLAGGSLFLSVVALAVTLFYFQPNVEAKARFTTDNTQENLPQNFIQTDHQTIKQTQTQGLPTQKSSKDTAEKSETESEFVSEGQNFKATAYCLKGRTANGGNVRRGIVAADRRILPLGSRIHLEAGSYSGFYTVTDTGGAIKGRILDIWMPSCVEAVRFGRKNVKVSVIGRKRSA